MWPFAQPKPVPKKSENYKLLLIEVPQENEQKPEAAEAMFSALHGIFQEHLSFEIVSESKFIRFYVYTPEALKDFVESQIYAQYPTVEIKEVADYTQNIAEGAHFASCELVFSKPDFFPIKTFPNFEVDPLAAITAPLSKVSEGEKIWISILIRPSREDWQTKGLSYVQAVKSGEEIGYDWKKILKNLLTDIWRAAVPSESGGEERSKGAPTLAGPVEEALKGIEAKTTKLGFETKIRLVSVSHSAYQAEHRLKQAVASFQQFSLTNLNTFVTTPIVVDDENVLKDYISRSFDKGFILNTEELASIFHLPNAAVKTPTIVWSRAKKGEPPSNLPIKGEVPPENLTVFAKTDFRHLTKEFGIKLPDRRLHMYLIGKTGTGKTNMLQNMTLDDINEGRGVAVVDPHGDYVEFILNRIPSRRINDVVLFDPSDLQYPIGFNLLENVDKDTRNIVASGLIGIFKKIWGDISWGPRLEYILRNTILSLMAYPDTTLLAVMKMLVDKRFREKVIAKVDDPVLRDFWINEYEKYDPKFRTEAVAPIQNKVGQFLSSSTIRNIVGQPKSSFNVREIMDTGKILLVSLPIGKIGEDNSALLGAMMITKLQMTAMERADVPEEQRRDFYLYVDEFQNFATEAFATILSEARKYHLNLTLANQYIAQLSESVRDAVFGNVGTVVSFRVGAQDAAVMAQEFAPVFDENDLVNLDKYYIYLKMSIDGITCPAFSAVTLPPKREINHNKEKIIRLSRERYGKPRDFVEKKIIEWMGESGGGALASTQPAAKIATTKTAREGTSEGVKEFLDTKGRKWYMVASSSKGNSQSSALTLLEEGKEIKIKK